MQLESTNSKDKTPSGSSNQIESLSDESSNTSAEKNKETQRSNFNFDEELGYAREGLKKVSSLSTLRI